MAQKGGMRWITSCLPVGHVKEPLAVVDRSGWGTSNELNWFLPFLPFISSFMTRLSCQIIGYVQCISKNLTLAVAAENVWFVSRERQTHNVRETDTALSAHNIPGCLDQTSGPKGVKLHCSYHNPPFAVHGLMLLNLKLAAMGHSVPVHMLINGCVITIRKTLCLLWNLCCTCENVWN